MTHELIPDEVDGVLTVLPDGPAYRCSCGGMRCAGTTAYVVAAQRAHVRAVTNRAS